MSLASSARTLALALSAGLALTAACKLKPNSAGTVQAQQATAPTFTLEDQDGKPVALQAMLARGPVVIVFYRGFW